MTHVRTALYYPQSNGKLERWNKSIKSECIRPGVPLSPDDAERLIVQYVAVYNEQRLHNSLGYLTPRDMLQGPSVPIQQAETYCVAFSNGVDLLSAKTVAGNIAVRYAMP
jgi:hypothetical protein